MHVSPNAADSRNRGRVVQVSWHTGITKKQENHRIGWMWLGEVDASAPAGSLDFLLPGRTDAKPRELPVDISLVWLWPFC